MERSSLDLDSVKRFEAEDCHALRQGQSRCGEELVSRRGKVRVTSLPDLIIIFIIIIIIIISLTGSSLRARLVVLATSNRNLTMVTASRLVKEAARTSSYRAITQTSSTAIGSTSNSPRLSVSSSVSRSRHLSRSEVSRACVYWSLTPESPEAESILSQDHS